MTTPTRTHAAIAGLLAIAGSFASSSSLADSGVGVDTVIGNYLNTAPRQPQPWRDPDGMGLTLSPRTPTGYLNNQPNLVPPPTPVNEWLYRASFEAGGLFGDGDTRNAYFRMYKDVNNGFLLNNFRVEAERPASANFVETFGGGVGRNDQFYVAQFGRYNDWRVRAFYNETVHVFTDTWKDLWTGVGTPSLTLPGSNPPTAGAICSNPPACTTYTSPVLGITAPTAQAAVNSAAARALDNNVRNAQNTEIGLQRKKGGLRGDLMLTDQWSVFFNATSEKRVGARPFGATWQAGGGGGNIETVEAIDYRTHDVVVGTQYADDRHALNVALTGSFFRNHIDTQTFQNPYLPATANGNDGALFRQGRYDLYPDNDYYNVKAEYAYRVPEWSNARFTAVVSASRLTQNDDLIPPSLYPGVSGGIAGGAWDTTASLYQRSSQARIDTRLVDLSAAFTPVKDLEVRGKVRYYRTDNDTEYTACNPLVGQFGRLVNEGTGSALVGFTTNTGAALTPARLAALNAFLQSNNCNVDALRTYVAANGLHPTPATCRS